MNRSRKIIRTTVCCLAIGALAAGSTFAREKPDRKDGDKCQCKNKNRGGDREAPAWHEETKEFRVAQREKIKAHMEEQLEANKAVREEAWAIEDPYEVVAALKSNRISSHEANQNFFEGIHQEHVAFMESMFSKYEVPAEKQEKIKEKMEAHVGKGQEKHAEHYEAVIAALDGLASKSDLTKEQIREAMKDLHPKRGGKHGKHGKHGNRGKDNKGDE
jgi:hypothetical protein